VPADRRNSVRKQRKTRKEKNEKRLHTVRVCPEKDINIQKNLIRYNEFSVKCMISYDFLIIIENYAKNLNFSQFELLVK